MKSTPPFLLSVIALLASFLFSGSAFSLPDQGSVNTMVFTRVHEPREKAFSVLIPRGWQVEGGIFRLDPSAQGGAAQSIAAKVDFAVKKDPAGTVLMRWLPDMLYFDPRYSPAARMGLMQTGSNYNGMLVHPLVPASQFMIQMAFPYAHPQARNVQIVRAKPLPNVARSYRQLASRFSPQMTFQYNTMSRCPT